jgi:hypothetical protein
LLCRAPKYHVSEWKPWAAWFRLERLPWARTTWYQRVACLLACLLACSAIQATPAESNSSWGSVELSSSLQCLLRSFGHRFNRATSCTTLGRLPHIAPLTAYQNSKKWRCGWWVFPSRSCPQVCEIETKPEDPSQEPKDRKVSLSQLPCFSRAQTRPLHQKGWGHY